MRNSKRFVEVKAVGQNDENQVPEGRGGWQWWQVAMVIIAYHTDTSSTPLTYFCLESALSTDIWQELLLIKNCWVELLQALGMNMRLTDHMLVLFIIFNLPLLQNYIRQPLPAVILLVLFALYRYMKTKNKMKINFKIIKLKKVQGNKSARLFHKRREESTTEGWLRH